ncbi:MAG: DNA-directed RNA polymerase subunit beta' [bacterium]|nr:DNA-directed RNA polymerase subunit beta' [bacterium]
MEKVKTTKKIKQVSANLLTGETAPKMNDFKSIRISVAGPDKIMEWSYGEVTKPETINYRTQKPEREGLFDERIFGPTKDWECYCGKYKKIRYKGVICDKCGVEITRSAVRRERMGHIDLAVPIGHIWYVRGVPSMLGLTLDLSLTDLEKVVYFAGYIILGVNKDVAQKALAQLESEYHEIKDQYLKGEKTTQSPEVLALDASYKQRKQEIDSLQVKKVLSEAQYHELSLRYGQIARVGIGAEAIYELLKQMNLDQTIEELKEEIHRTIGVSKRRLLKRLKLLIDMKKAGINPEWLVLVRLPVIPPDLRPMVQLDGGRFAASDLNDLYRRVLNRNNRLKRLISQAAPEVIQRNEKRMLQEAVDALIDNSARHGRAASTGTQRRLRSLSDMLRGKQGRFRQNLLGKRVDYSGRSVIVVGPELKLHQCGLPKVMALELFKPFVISKLIIEGYVHNVKNATRLIERGTPEVWDILERITSDAQVLLNRAPTLHRLGIQAFQPVLIEGKAIQIHPLVCPAFNADFDGDQMAVHVPLSSQAVYEAKHLMQASKNILKPASGEPVVMPRQDMVFGCYYLTSAGENLRGENKIFANKNEAILAHQQGFLHIRSKIKVRVHGEMMETTVGRILFNNILPEQLQFVNDVMDTKKLKKIVSRCFRELGTEVTAQLVDKIMTLGFQYATQSGATISVEDLQIPQKKNEILRKAETELDEINKRYRRGLITDQERSMKTIGLWNNAKSLIEKEMHKEIDKNNPVYIMVSSGARGSFTQLIQLSGMKGLVVNPAGEIIELPIKSNFKEGLSVFEYFISTHGARKGKSDTSLKTSDAGYLTRRLIDVAQDVIVSESDCGSTEGVKLTVEESEQIGETLEERLVGRVTIDPVYKPKTKQVIVAGNTEMTEDTAKQIFEAGITEVTVRSPMSCMSSWGICQKCYGRDLTTGLTVAQGEAVGILAAQAIGEPGTQLTMRTFHLGGVTGEDITSGLPRVEELFEARPPKSAASMSEVSGKVSIREEKDQRIITVTSDEIPSETIIIEDPYKFSVADRDAVKPKQVVAVAANQKAIRASIGGKASIKGHKLIITSTKPIQEEYVISPNATLKVKHGEMIQRGQDLSEGHLELARALELKGTTQTQSYIIRGVQEIYSTQGQAINDKHVEIIVREMFSKVRIKDGGDSELIPGQIIDRLKADTINDELKKDKAREIDYEQIVLGISRVALNTESFLSAASFQETTSILIGAAMRGAQDNLKGLKENVIIGKLIPAGSGYSSRKK